MLPTSTLESYTLLKRIRVLANNHQHGKLSSCISDFYSAARETLARVKLTLGNGAPLRFHRYHLALPVTEPRTAVA